MTAYGCTITKNEDCLPDESSFAATITMTITKTFVEVKIKREKLKLSQHATPY